MENLSFNDYVHGGTQKDHYDENERENCICPLCNSTDFIQVASDRGLGVVKCSQCDLIYTNPRAKNAEMNYFGDASLFFEEARLIFSGKKKHHRDRNYEYELRKIKQIKPNGRLLDIGTNAGFFLRKAREFGYLTEGVEPSPALSGIAREQFGLNIHTGFLQDIELEKSTFDVITLIDVLEHVTDPINMLQKCHELVNADGIVAIKVPNGDYNLTKDKLASYSGKKGNMDIWDCFEHVVHYTPSTFRKMADKCGFEIVTYFIPLPIHSPIWANLTGHYFQYPTPFILDWKRILLRNAFYFAGRIERVFSDKIRFGPDLMFIIRKKR